MKVEPEEMSKPGHGYGPGSGVSDVTQMPYSLQVELLVVVIGPLAGAAALRLSPKPMGFAFVVSGLSVMVCRVHSLRYCTR